MEPSIRVNLVGGNTLTRDVIAHVLNEAGMDVSEEEPGVTASNQVALVIAEDGEPGRLLLETAARRAVVVTDIDVNDEAVVDLVLEGADAVLGLDATAQELAEAVRTVASGGNLLAPRPIRRLSELARSSRVVTTS